MASDWSIAIDRSIALSAGDVYRAWTDPHIVKRWMAPGTMRVAEPRIDAIENGQWQLEMVDVDGSRQRASGRYLSLDEPTSLALTWEWDGAHYETKIVVSIEQGTQGKIDISLEQSGFPSMDAAQSHEAGWNGCLDKLEKLGSGTH